MRWMSRLKQLVVPAIILFMAVGIVFLIAGNWNTWASERPSQQTDDAYVRADLTPLSTKVAGLVATVQVSDYQAVKAGQLLVQLRDEDFRAQVQQAEAGVIAGQDSLVNNQRQKELQDARIVQAEEGIHAAEADIAAAEAGIDAAKASMVNARSGIDATKADVERTLLERRRQEALIATESTTRQKLESLASHLEAREKMRLFVLGRHHTFASRLLAYRAPLYPHAHVAVCGEHASASGKCDFHRVRIGGRKSS
jgi:membrane fusion protein (multidrug efflux system)